jgi:hypothetical protein
MHILFIDESGTPPPPGKERPRYFVLGGAIIGESDWHGVRDALLGLKSRHRIRGELKWRYFAPANDDVRNPMRKLGQDIRDTIRTELYEIIRSRGVTTIAAICSAKAAYAMPSVNTQEDVYHLTYKVLSERFQYYLQGLSRNKTGRSYGVMVADHRGSQDDRRLRGHHEMLVHSGAEFTSRYTNIVESLFVQPSNLSVGIQLATWWRARYGGSTSATMIGGMSRSNRLSADLRPAKSPGGDW